MSKNRKATDAATPQQEPAQKPLETNATPVSVVAIGASAGGLAAYRQFFAAMPADSGLAFVLVQHLDPRHESLTAELLAKATRMQVLQAEHQMQVQANHVYVIPPNAYISIEQARLQLSKPVPQHGMRLPIDYFMLSLAHDRHERAVGILLSGTGRDGTLGLKAIRAEGGLTMAQHPDSAEFNGMVCSAIDLGTVDIVDVIDRLPLRLLDYLRASPLLQRAPVEQLASSEALQTILNSLRRHSKYDFRGYKEGTLIRRILRRMGIRNLKTLEAYNDYLGQHPDEIKQLFRDLLISVTGFFREPEAFEALGLEVAAKQVQAKPSEPIRIWVPGCATGEEAYSLAILYAEQAQRNNSACELQIYATDIDDQALEVARAGIYPASVADNITAARLQHYFNKDDSHYRVRGSIREAITFACQNLIADPPFSKLDLISCRNLMIYLHPETQRQVIALFHFALKADGYLFLGNSESIGSSTELFATVDKKNRIFQRKPASRQQVTNFPPGLGPTNYRLPYGQGQTESQVKKGQLSDIVRQLLLERFAPAAVLVNRRYQIQYYHGPIDRYLRRPTGMPSDDLFMLAREGLLVRLRPALYKAMESNKPVTLSGAQVLVEAAPGFRVKVTVQPVPSAKADAELFLVVFEDEPSPAAALEHEANSDSGELHRLLELELNTTRNDLQGTIEELEAANEELMSANEEIMSMNEELQSSNEELESSKEELQSMNEEIITVNGELQAKVDELELLSNDLNNLLSSTHIATLFIDRKGIIKRYTPTATRLFNVIPTDLGRPVSDITHRFVGAPNFFAEARAVLESLSPLETELQTLDGEWYLQRVLPYQTDKFTIEGLVLTFINISGHKQEEETLRRLATLLRDSNDAIIVMDSQGTVLDWNKGAERMYGWAKAQMLGQSIMEITPEFERQAARDLLVELAQGKLVDSLQTQRTTNDGRTLDVWLTCTAIKNDQGQVVAIALTERDITERKQAELLMQKATLVAEQANRQKSQFLAAVSHDLRQPLQTLELLNGTLRQQAGDAAEARLVAHQGEVLRIMQDLLNNLLDIGQLEAQNITIKRTEFSTQLLFDELDTQFQQLAREKGIALRFRPCGALLYGDKSLLQPILANFISNALKYTDTGTVLVAGRLRGSHLRLQVWDTGCGIAEDQCKRIFDEFYQINNPARARSSGVGLGLTIAQRLADYMGHRLALHSRLGRGSVLSVEVPLATARQAQALAQQPDSMAPDSEQDASAPAAKPDSVAAKTAWLIEDDPLVSYALVQFLNYVGLEVVPSVDGDKLLASLENGGTLPDVLISDYRLPGRYNGLELIQKLREISGRDLPAVLLTGDTFAVSREQMDAIGCALLYKPVDSAQLLNTINRICT